MTDQQAQRIQDLRKRNIPYKQIAAELQMPLNTVKSYCLRHHLNTEALKPKSVLCRN